MARPARSERSRSARPSRQLSRFYHSINPDRVFGTHSYSSSHPKTHRAAVGFTPGCVKRAKECWNESRTINGSAPAAKTRKTRRLEPAPHLSSSGSSVLAELGHSKIQNKPLLNGTIPGQADWTRLRPQRRARRGNPDAVHCLTPSGILDYIGLSVPQRWGRLF